ncbi:uncharacterized protein METZ01_LOCUS417182, partial [marine metagenome]
QQMFADLNRYAVKPSASIGVLYDHRDPLSSVTRAIVASSPLLRDVVELEKSALSPRSRKLFTLSAIFGATRALLSDIEEEDLPDHIDTGAAFWDGINEGFIEWDDVREGRLTAGEVRKDFIHSHGTVLHAFGRVGRAALADGEPNWKDIGVRLGELDWRRSNTWTWEGRALVGGRVSKSKNNVVLTTNVIKAHLGFELSLDERAVEVVHVMAEKEQ